MAPSRRIAVVGQGFVGLPAAMLAVQAGHSVVGYDTDPYRVLRLEHGDSYVADVSSARLVEALHSGRYLPTGDPDALEGFDIALIAVPTPATDDRPDLSCIEAAAKTLAAYLRPRCLVILESTTYPGTTVDIVAPALETSGLTAGRDFRLGYAPERLDPGAGLDGVVHVPKIAAGIDEQSLRAVVEFWSGLVDTVVPAPDIQTAEFAKLVENAFRLVNISFVNELTRDAAVLGVSVWAALQLAATKPYGYMPFHPGAGAGGHCLPSDTAYLAWCLRTQGHPSPLIETAARVNRNQPGYVAQRIMAGLIRRFHTLTPDRARIVLLGATYKPDVADVRDSCALKVSTELRRTGAEVIVVDPLATDVNGVLAELTLALVAQASAVAVLVAHHGLDYDLIRRARYVFDACGVLEPGPNIEQL
ncbi:nucleotide sugar dehydrogenase [Nocardia sp. NPDC004860]|uniref:nucleotide sugar dehydrogenase n=1 Tax=Nocardia sp. NPDC004860 TaxID=3154557 RepID=UPI00339E118C